MKYRLRIICKIFPYILTIGLVFTQITSHPDVLATSESFWLVASDAGQGDYFGRSVSISGDTIAVGAYGSYAGGAVYIFVRDGSTWVEQAKLRPSDGTADDCFGYAVSISGDTALVGAYQSNQNTGAAYIFVRTGLGYWTEQAKLTASDGVAGDRFGFDVSISGDTSLVGDYQSSQEKGAAYVFNRRGPIWSQQTKLTASDGITGDGFGSSVSISGDTALIGAYHSDQDTGAAYVFTRSGSNWAQQTRLNASGGTAKDWFGADVSISGDTALIGAYHSDEDTGAAYAFTRSGSDWTQQARLKASGIATGDFFGYSVSISGDTALVGAYHAAQDTGAAYVFLRSGSNWNESPGLTPAESLMPKDWFGYSVSVNEETIVVGTPRKIDRGAVYLGNNPGYTLAGEANKLILPIDTVAATLVTTTSATLNGNLTSMGEAATVNVYFEYGNINSLARDINTPYYYYGKQTPVQIMDGTGAFRADISGLTPGTTYHFRARVDASEIGVSFGPDMIFTTPPLPGGTTPGATQSPLPETVPETLLNTWLRKYHRLIIASIVISLGAIVIKLDVDNRARKRPIHMPTAIRTTRPGYDVAFKKLEELIELKKTGVISDEQYRFQKSEILKEMRGSEASENDIVPA